MGGFFRRTKRDGRLLLYVGLVMFFGTALVAFSGGVYFLGPFWIVKRGLIGATEFSIVFFASPLVIVWGLIAMTGRLDPARRAKTPT